VAKPFVAHNAIQPVTAVQSEYSLVVEGPRKRRCYRLSKNWESGFVPFSPLGKGLPHRPRSIENTKFDSTDFRNIVPRFTPEARKANQALIDLLNTVAERKRATPAQDRALPGCWPGKAVDCSNSRHHESRSGLRRNIGSGCDRN